MFKRHSKPLHVASSCVADRDNVQNPIPGARGEGEWIWLVSIYPRTKAVCRNTCAILYFFQCSCANSGLLVSYIGFQQDNVKESANMA